MAWAISNLCRGKNPPAPLELLKKCMPILLQHDVDKEVLADACWALSQSNLDNQIILQPKISGN